MTNMQKDAKVSVHISLCYLWKIFKNSKKFEHKQTEIFDAIRMINQKKRSSLILRWHIVIQVQIFNDFMIKKKWVKERKLIKSF